VDILQFDLVGMLETGIAENGAVVWRCRRPHQQALKAGSAELSQLRTGQPLIPV
jgi:hypothetical protein